MAVYVGNYQSDTSKQFQCVGLTVGFIEVTTGEIRGNFSTSTAADDQRYLPGIWFQENQPKQPRQNICSLPHTPRFALLWVTNTLYLRVPLPWIPNSVEYNQFFTSLAIDFSDKLVSVGQLGERITNNWLKIYVK